MKAGERLGVLLWFRLSRFYNRSIRETNQHLKKWNVSAAQFDVLVQIGGNDRLTQSKNLEISCLLRKEMLLNF